MPALVDHENGVRHHNQWINLRAATDAQNCQNRRARRVGPKGVYKSRDRYRAEIVADGIRRNLGTFATEAEAAEVYRLAALRYHGEFAVKEAA